MNNAWTVAFRSPCAGLQHHPVQPWRIAARIATGRSISSSPYRGGEALRTANYCPQPPARRLRPSSPFETCHTQHTSRRTFAATAWLCKGRAATRKPVSTKKPAPAPPPKTSPTTTTPKNNPTTSTAPAPKQDPGIWANELNSEEWRNYSPETGIPRPAGAFSAAEITAILGPGVSAETGNRLLSILQYRRVSGSLADVGIAFPAETSGFSVPPELPLRALEYLRANYPVDEEAAAVRWAEEEARRIEEELVIQRGESLGLYKKEEAAPEQGTEFGQRYGSSALDGIRAQAERRAAEEEEQRKKQAENAGGNVGTLQTVGQRAELTTPEKEKWWKKYEEQALITKEKRVPHISTFKRLFPSALVTLTTLALCIAFAQLYSPPPRSSRLWPDTPPAAATCISILAMNAAVFLLWRFPPMWRLLNRYCYVAPGYPIALSMIGNVFSHQQFTHFFWNMLLLMLVGTQLHEQIGRGNFLALYLASGVTGSFASLCYYVARRNFVTVSLGASGAMAGVVAAFCLTSPGQRFAVPFTDYSFSMSTQIFLAALIGMEIVGMVSGKSKVDHVSHLGGYAAGMVGAWLFRRQAGERRRKAEERKREMGFLNRTVGK